jgi:HAD superfamily hydrolase (TIGR01509 family)
MVKLIVFDLDGVLVNAKEIHYKALNEALVEIDPKYEIDLEEHLAMYDGLPTKKKLDLLTVKKGLPKELHDQIWKLKQTKTSDVIRNHMARDERLCNVLSQLHKHYKIHVASNSISESVRLMLYKTGLIEYVDYYISNEDVKHSKPNSEMYFKCMIHAGVNPSECVIVEDSYVGRKAAAGSGASVLGVEKPEDVTVEKVTEFIKALNRPERAKKWSSDNLTVLIPMAGAGKRFQQAGYTFPKPLIEVRGKPMIQVIVDNLGIDAHYVFVVQKEHYEQYNLKYLLNLISPNCDIVQVDSLTEGAACTTLLAEKYIDNDKHLLIANSDQFVEWDSSEFMYSMTASGLDGGILTFTATHPKWSFVKVDENNLVTEVAEKMPISNIANVGVYYWKHGSDYVKYTKQMIEKNVRTNGEFYVAPVYNEAIADGKKITNYSIQKMWGLGTPEDLVHYLQNYNEEK